MELSLNNIDQLPSIENLKKNAQSLALLDAILMPDWEYRYFSFNSKWNVGEMMSSMRDGSGNEYFILFCPTGAVGKVLYSQMRIDATVNPVPETFRSFKNENAFSLADATYFFWRKSGEKTWSIEPQSKPFLLKFLKGDASDYFSWAEEYYERKINFSALCHIYNTKEINESLVSALNPDVSLSEIRDDIDEILG